MGAMERIGNTPRPARGPVSVWFGLLCVAPTDPGPHSESGQARAIVGANRGLGIGLPETTTPDSTLHTTQEL